MKIIKSSSDSDKMTTSQEIYDLQADIIPKKTFTRREIDIIACLLNGRAIKKMAQLLSISPKTAETHVRNILLKLECRTQEGIIDLVEKSDHYNLLKTHYTNLLSNASFETELRKLAPLINNQNKINMIIYDNDQRNIKPFFFKLSNHLKILGINCLIRKMGTAEVLEHEGVLKKDEYVTYCISSATIDIFLQNLNKIKKINTFFLLLDNDALIISSRELLDYHCIDFSKTENYYVSFLKLLRRLPNFFGFGENIEELEKKITFYTDTARNKIYPGNISFDGVQNSLSKSIFNIKTRKVNKSFLTASLMILASLLIFFSFIHAKTKSHNQESQFSQLARNGFKQMTSYVDTKINSGDSLQWNLPPQHHQFVGREKLLEKIHEELQIKLPMPEQKNKTHNTEYPIGVFSGLGGVGKTQLALQYLNYPYSLKAWFYAENLDQLRNQYLEFAKFIGCKEENPSFKSALSYIKNWLSNHPGWLIVFDNVNSYEEIMDFLPEEGGSIILTTRQRNWPNTFKIINIDVMTEEESIKLIESVAHIKFEKNEVPEVKELVNILGFLPLAMAQASAYMRQNSVSVGTYLELYKAHEQELLLDQTLPLGTRSLPIEVTWKVNFDAILKESKTDNQPPLALNILMACAYMSPEKIPRNFLLTWFKETYPNWSSDELLFPKLISQLWKYSIINKDDHGNIMIHRLVQAVIRHRHRLAIDKADIYFKPLTLEWYNKLLKSIHIEFQRETNALEDEARRRDLLPHLKSLVKHYDELWLHQSQPTHVGDVLCDIADIMLNQMYNPKAAKPYYERGLNIQELYYGSDHPEVVRSLRNLASVYRKLGDYHKTKLIFEKVLSIQEKKYGKNHPNVAADMGNLGFAQRLFGNYQVALNLLESALSIQEQHYGSNHLALIPTLGSLAIVHYKIGHYEKAREILERSISILEPYYGKYHPKIAYCLRDLGFVHAMVGDPKKAIDLLNQALSIQVQHCGNDNPTTAFTLRDLGFSYYVAKDLDNAQLTLEKALLIQENNYEKDQPEIAFTLQYLGKTYLRQGNYIKAKNALERALFIQGKFYGENHPETLSTLQILKDIPSS